jgi:hypothetical protein
MAKEISHEEYMRILRMFATTTGDEAEDNRLAKEAEEETHLAWLHDEDFPEYEEED